MQVVPQALADEVLAFIRQQQAEPATATGYLDGPAAVADQLAALAPPWRQTVRAVRDSSGGVVGAVLVEWSMASRRAWIYGPWTAPHDWQDLASELTRVAMEQVPAEIDDFELCGDVANQRLRQLARGLGWEEGEVHFLYEASAVSLRAYPADPPPLRLATPADVAGIAPLHDAAFPRTFLTAPECLQPSRVTLVYDDGEIAGYVSAQRQPGGEGLIDFLAVAPHRRRAGIGRALLVGATRHVRGDRILLQSADRFRESWGLFHELGFAFASAFRGYRAVGRRAGGGSAG